MSSVQHHQLFQQIHSEINLVMKNRSQVINLKFNIEKSIVLESKQKINKRKLRRLGYSVIYKEISCGFHSTYKSQKDNIVDK